MAEERLTQRELQCVALAGQGLTDKEIAHRLRPSGRGMSPKTVSNHLSSAYLKLGVTSRAAAADAVARNYPIPPIPIAVPLPSPPDQAVTVDLPNDPGDGARSDNPLYRAYVGLGPLRVPPRWGGTRFGLILVWTFLGLMMIVAGLGVITVFGSVNRFAEDANKQYIQEVSRDS